MKSQNDDEDDRGHHSDEDKTAEIMQKTEARKKFLRRAMRAMSANISSQR